MIGALSLGITGLALVAGVAVGAGAARGTYQWVRYAPTLALVQFALVAQAVADAVGLARGHRPAESVTHLAYLVVSVLVVPAVATQVRRDDGRWAGVLVAAALFVVAVLVIRLQTTWWTGRG